VGAFVLEVHVEAAADLRAQFCGVNEGSVALVKSYDFGIGTDGKMVAIFVNDASPYHKVTPP
jgi:hypothetical protein